MAIHCEPVSEETSRPRALADTMDCRVSRFRSFLAMTKSYVVTEPYTLTPPTLSSRGRKPVAIHCEPVNEETSRTYALEPRWIAASARFRSLLAMTNVCYHQTIHSTSLILSSRGRSPWRSTVNQ